MIKRIALLACFCVPVMAADIPQGSNLDGRIQYTNYNSGEVYNLYLQAGISTWIVLNEDETIVKASSGFTDGYFIEVDGHVLDIKPLSVMVNNVPVQPVPDQWRTNLSIRTDKNRFYNFDVQLISSTDKGFSGVAHRVEFRYPVERVEAARVQVAQEQAAAVKAKPVAVIPKNAHYSMRVGKDSASIKPVKMFDDGVKTYITFKGEIPAVFMLSADGETLVNSHTDPHHTKTLVIHRVTQTLVLRLGKAVITLHNDNYRG